MQPVTIQQDQIITFDYINWRGEYNERTAKVYYMQYGATEYHPKPQWLLVAFDRNKQAIRTFAMQDMRNIKIIE